MSTGHVSPKPHPKHPEFASVIDSGTSRPMKSSVLANSAPSKLSLQPKYCAIVSGGWIVLLYMYLIYFSPIFSFSLCMHAYGYETISLTADFMGHRQTVHFPFQKPNYVVSHNDRIYVIPPGSCGRLPDLNPISRTPIHRQGNLPHYEFCYNVIFASDRFYGDGHSALLTDVGN